jgi:uncharacterized protein YfaS (alpha-2-macroglobulin family)
MKETKFTITEGTNAPISLELQPAKPYLRMSAGQHVFFTKERGSVYAEGFGFDDSIDVHIYAVNFNELASSGGLQSVLSASYRWNSGLNTENRNIFTPLEGIRHEIVRRDAEGAYVEDVGLPALGPGMYWVSASTSSEESGTWVAISDVALILKKSGKDFLCFATNIQTGAAISAAPITVHQKAEQFSVGSTGADGLLRFQLPPGVQAGECTAVASVGSSRAIVGFNQYENEGMQDLQIFVYTDRPIYRPGDLIQYKCVLKRLVGENYAIPANLEAVVEVRDPDDNLIKTERLTTNSFGGVSGSVQLNSGALTGEYSVQCSVGEAQQTTMVPVETYRKPEYSVTVTGAKPYFVRGDRASARVSARYFFGGPVAGATVSATIYRAPEWSPYYYGDEDLDFETEGYEEAGELVKTVEAVTDGQGNAIISFDTGGQKTDDPESDYVYTVSVDVADKGGKYYSGEGKIKVARGEYALYLDTDTYVTKPGGSATLTAIAESHVGKKPVANAVVEVAYGYETWDGRTSHLRVIGRKNVRTGSDGRVSIPITAPDAGSFVVEATGEDSRGNEIKTRAYIYVTDSSGFDFASQPGNVKLILDKKQYKVGDMAKVLLDPGTKGGSALITVEGGGIYFQKVVSIESGSGMAEFPVLPSYAPNAYVNVAFVSKKKYYEGTKRLNVDLSKRTLSIDIRSDKSTYQPRETATYNITTKDQAGNPVRAELSFGVVDEAIYAIREDDSDILSAFYPKRYNAVQTYYSFPEIYLGDADKDKVTQMIREKFVDTAFWKASVVTGNDGTATITVRLPDNVTTWRATAMGTSAESAVGKGVQKIVSRKPVMIRFQAPRFLTQKDRIMVSAVVHNDTGKDADFSVKLGIDGVARVVGGNAKSVRVDNGEPETVQWEIEANGFGSATFTASAQSPGGSDAMRVTVPVIPYGRTITESVTSDTKTMASTLVTVRNGYVRGTGAVTVSLSPTLASSLLGSLEYLVGYPYGCTEQTMSRFLPSVVVAGALKNLGISNPQLQKQLPDMIGKGYLKLRSMQHGDGGWGWWEYDDSDPWMTAYVLDGFHRAAQAGFPPPKYALESGIEWAKRYLDDLEQTKKFVTPSADALRLLAGIAVNGEADYVRKKTEQIDLSKMVRSDEVIPLIRIYSALGADYAAAQTAAVRRLESMAQTSGSRAYWEERWYGVETTAQAIDAIASVDSHSALLPKAIRWLLLERNGDHWFSTRDTAFVLLGLVKYMVANEEARPNYAANLTINGAVYKTIRVTPQTLAANNFTVEIPFEDLRPGMNTLGISLSGPGNCYYTISSRQVVDTGQLPRVLTGEDLRIQREYFRLETRRLDDGTLRLLPSRKPIDDFDAGELVRCRLTIESGKPREFIMIEDPVPSSCEITDRDEPAPDEIWDQWWSRTDIRDDKIVFFARRLPKGTSTIEYTMRAENPGDARALPTVISNMYDPDVRATTGEARIEVER